MSHQEHAEDDDMSEDCGACALEHTQDTRSGMSQMKVRYLVPAIVIEFMSALASSQVDLLESISNGIRSYGKQEAKNRDIRQLEKTLEWN